MFNGVLSATDSSICRSQGLRYPLSRCRLRCHTQAAEGRWVTRSTGTSPSQTGCDCNTVIKVQHAKFDSLAFYLFLEPNYLIGSILDTRQAA